MQITESAFPKVSKQTQARLQAAADRALSEQVAVIRSWRQARSCLSQWTEHASAAAPTLQNVSKRYKILVEQAVRDLQQKSSSLSLITQALGEAESARIRAGAAPANDDTVHLGTSSRNSSFRRGGGATGAGAGAAISPLDSLARGSAGREVAALVIALRANQDELVGTAQTVSALGCTLVSELRRELDFFGHTEASLTAAANATHGVLQQSSRLGDILPQGCAAAMAVSAQEQEEALLSTGPASAGLRKGTRRRAAEATSSPTSTKGTTSGKQQATPLSNRPAFDLSMN